MAEWATMIGESISDYSNSARGNNKLPWRTGSRPETGVAENVAPHADYLRVNGTISITFWLRNNRIMHAEVDKQEQLGNRTPPTTTRRSNNIMHVKYIIRS